MWRRIRWRSLIEFVEIVSASMACVFTDATSESVIIGGTIAFLGAGLFTWTGGFQRMEREGVLTLGGPYRFVRHPWILARFMMVFGLILMSRRPWLFILTMLALAPVYRRMARDEDQWLYAQLGPAAAEYRAFVSGFIPQFMPAKLPGVGRSVIIDGFSWNRSLWKRPGRASLALAGVGLSVCVQIVWTLQLVSLWVWFSLVGLLAAVALGWLIRDRRLQAAL